MTLQLSDLPEKYQKQAREQLFPLIAKMPLNEVAPKLPKPQKKTKTEEEYERIYLRDRPHKFEGISFKMDNGHRYTPDFFVWSEEDGDILECHEVKGGYKLASYGRAKLAFDQCQKEFLMFKFVWATKTKEGWDIR